MVHQHLFRHTLHDRPRSQKVPYLSWELNSTWAISLLPMRYVSRKFALAMIDDKHP